MLTELLVQSDWLAQRPNVGDWGEFLFIAIVVILWLASALAKALGKKRKAERQQRPERTTVEQRPPRETWQQKLARKAEEMQRAAEAQRGRVEQEARARTEARETPPERLPAEPMPSPGGRVTVRPGRRGESVIIYERPTEAGPSQQEQRTAQQREARKAVAEARRRTRKKPAPIGARRPVGRTGAEPITESISGVMREPPGPLEPDTMRLRPAEPAGFQPATIIDSGDPDALMTAILHYEILGKPLALRESYDEPSSF